MSHRLFNLVSALLLSTAAHAQAACDETLVKDLVGKTFDSSTENEAKAKAGADAVRSTTPGGIFFTKDLNKNRLSITVDQEGKIKGFTCS
ncbi:I78 family peptidase inhibitor [Pseudomonas sp. 21TX0197]|jgi:hypothetical protein|uniref:I78 family peptidase inhibitor n=1 Tax=Pseudomonas TaxID=286 RepID=UPI001404E90C|nr:MULTISPECIES: I78 family peptidase inhibitor [Pseudomonas]MDB6442235.1 I78 family peptidase inhibitor [Pseudomonas sp. 21TX0197]MDT8908570.1 I78 family peptidase inhibitor [Pseudomonas prosekii]NHN71318.1 hypothetical protein [Pseudomonas fluorescens]